MKADKETFLPHLLNFKLDTNNAWHSMVSFTTIKETSTYPRNNTLRAGALHWTGAEYLAYYVDQVAVLRYNRGGTV